MHPFFLSYLSSNYWWHNFKLDGPVGERPPPATNLTLTQEAGGYVLRWQGPSDPTKILYYTVEIKKDGQGEKWGPLTDHRIDTEEASYMSKFNNCDKNNYRRTLIVAQYKKCWL
jgi:hypothetical protein